MLPRHVLRVVWCYLHVRVVRVGQARPGLWVRVAACCHASQVARLRTEGVTSSGTLHHRTSAALKLGADHQLRQNMSQKVLKQQQ